MPFKPAPHLKAFDYVGVQRYFLTTCTPDRRALFTDAAVVSDATVQLRHISRVECFAVIAYCFMPDHVHLVLEGTSPSSNLKEFVRMYKQRSSFAWKQQRGFTLWQRGYVDRVLRTNEDAVTVARYVLHNPVRAGLARTPAEYPYSGSFVMSVADLLGSIQMQRRT